MRLWPREPRLYCPSERALAGLFHELAAEVAEVAEQGQVLLPKIELDPRRVWRVYPRLLGKVDYPRLAPLEVYAPAALCCIHCIFVCYPSWSYLFRHKRKSPYRAGPRRCYKRVSELRRIIFLSTT